MTKILGCRLTYHLPFHVLSPVFSPVHFMSCHVLSPVLSPVFSPTCLKFCFMFCLLSCLISTLSIIHWEKCVFCIMKTTLNLSIRFTSYKKNFMHKMCKLYLQPFQHPYTTSACKQKLPYKAFPLCLASHCIYNNCRCSKMPSIIVIIGISIAVQFS